MFRRASVVFSFANTDFFPPALAPRRLKSKYAAHSASFDDDSRSNLHFDRGNRLTCIYVGRAHFGLTEFRLHLYHSRSGYAFRFETAEDLGSASL